MLSMSDNELPEFETGAAFNSGIAYLFELTMIRRKLHETRVEENYHSYFLLCEAYFIALSSEMKIEEDPTKQKSSMMGQQKLMYKKARENDEMLMLMIQQKKKTVPANLINDTKEWELELRQCEKKLGLLMPDKSDPGTALMGGHY